MLLVLRSTSSANGLSARFDSSGGLIGRAETARLVVPDPTRTVSRYQAHVSCVNGVFYIEDMGSANPTQLNGRLLRSGLKQELKLGDTVGVGVHTLAVEFEHQTVDPASAPSSAAHGNGSAYLVPEMEQHTEIMMMERPSPFLSRKFVAEPDNAELWRAFEEGAQVRVDLPQGLRPELMRVLGSMLRVFAVGTRRLLHLQTHSKRFGNNEMNGSRVRHRNPLRFAPDEGRAVSSLLTPPLPGFLPGLPAVEEAMHDLELHERAMMNAVRAALERVFNSVDPAQIERAVKPAKGLSLFGTRRKASLWDRYVAQFRQLGGDDKRSFMESFNRAVAEAYEAELVRLESQRLRTTTGPAVPTRPLAI